MSHPSQNTKWLEGELNRWVSEGIIDSGRADAIRRLYPDRPAARPWAIIVFSGLGACIIGLGIILLFAYNWHLIPKFGKLGIVFGSLIIAHAIGITLFFYTERFRMFGEAVTVLGTMLFGAGIWLVAQVYHIDEHYPTAFVFWGIGAFVLAWSMPSAIQAIMAAVLFTIWAACESAQFGRAIYLAIPAIILLCGDMPLAMQAKLLRVLQDREITRLGSNDPIKVDVRFIAATNRDLTVALREKTFREDLYFRVRAAVIELPPLRNRREDIPLLINHVISRSAEKLGKKIEGIESDARNVLVAHPWPGNVRELENTVENMIVLASGPKLSLADVPPYISGVTPPMTAIVPLANVPAPSTAITLAGMNLADLERKAIEETLASVHGNREQAAKILGIGERTLYRKLKDYGIQE